MAAPSLADRRHLEDATPASRRSAVSASSAGPARSTPSSARTARARARCSASPAARGRPGQGRVEILGRELTAADPLLARRLGLATVYQDDSLVRELTVAQNLLLAASDDPMPMSGRAPGPRNSSPRSTRPISPDALVGELTAAERQFLEIVKALAAKPKVLLLDEPTSSLDRAGVAKLTAIIRRITAEGTAVVYVSHRLPEILALANRVTILRDGVGQGTYAVDDKPIRGRSDRAHGRPADRIGIPATMPRSIRRRVALLGDRT